MKDQEVEKDKIGEAAQELVDQVENLGSWAKTAYILIAALNEEKHLYNYLDQYVAKELVESCPKIITDDFTARGIDNSMTTKIVGLVIKKLDEATIGVTNGS